MSSHTEVVAGMTLTKHPIIHLPTEDEILELVKTVGTDGTIEILNRREEKIKA